MVRGRRKCAKAQTKLDVGNVEELLSDGPKKKDSKLSKEFKGYRLSHTSPQFNDVCITRFFSPVSPVEGVTIKEEIDNTQPVSTLGRTSPRRHGMVPPPLSSTHNVGVQDEKPVASVHSPQTPHKIQFCSNEMSLSPSSALSLLHISQTPKKAMKSRRRLNPSQIANQQVAPKLSCCKQFVIPSPNHKLTEYFPVRRSERKTKRAVLEEQQRSLEEAVLAQQEGGLEVHNFVGKGRGIVATRMFCKGEFVVEYKGELIDMGVAKEREKKYAQDQNTGCYMYYFKHRNDQFCVDATAESGRLGRLVNHSRNGNLVTKTVVIMNRPHLVLIAKEDIQPGEEVMYDYGDRSKESIRYHPWLSS